MKPFMVALIGSALVSGGLTTPTARDSPMSSSLEERDNFNYVFSTFTAIDEDTEDETSQLDIYVSIDGINFAPYAMNAFSPPWGLLRDPSIVKVDDTYYLTYTTGSPTDIGLIKSKDLKVWDSAAIIKINEDDVDSINTWAPELFLDTDGSAHIIVSCQPPAKIVSPNPEMPREEQPFHAYILHATSDDLSSWSIPHYLDVDDNDEGSEQSHIDFFPFVVPSDPDYPYHAFQKNEEEKHIEQLHAKSINGPWEYMDGFTNDWRGWGEQEGPAVTKLRNGKWIVWMDNFAGTFSYSLTSDMNDPEAFTSLQPMPGHSDVFRHGTVIKL